MAIVLAGASGPLTLAQSPADANRQERQRERAIRETIADPNFRLRVDPNLSITERSFFDVGGSFTFSTLWIEDGTEEYSRLLQPEFTLFARAIIDGAHQFFFRSRFEYRAFSEGDSFDDNGDRWTEPFIDRYWYDFNLGRAVAAQTGVQPQNNLRFRVGRQFIDWGQGLVLSDELFAVNATATFGKIEVTGLAGVTPTDEAIIDFDGSRSEFDTNTERAFFGGEIRYTTDNAHELYFGYMRMEDWNSDEAPAADLTVLGIADTAVDFTYEANYFSWGAEGSITSNLAYEGEFVFQSGRAANDPTQSIPFGGEQDTDDISAFAFRTQLEYLLGDERRTRFEFEVLGASGDDDRLISTDTVFGNRPGTDDNAFNSLGFVNTGLAFSPAFSNLLVFRIGGSTFPIVENELFRNLQVGMDIFIHNKLDQDGPIDETTGEDLPRGDGEDQFFLGLETDFSLNWRVSSDFSITGRYGVFFPTENVFQESDTRHFLFLGATVTF
ncbi:MAG: hypothetical protein AAGI30_02970 [Planctomycetota bacterium]